jgi:hypothetical protein
MAFTGRNRHAILFGFSGMRSVKGKSVVDGARRKSLVGGSYMNVREILSPNPFASDFFFTEYREMKNRRIARG